MGRRQAGNGLSPFMADKKTNLAWVSGGFQSAKNLLLKIREKFAACEVCECTADTSISQLLSNMNSNQCFSENRLVIIFGLPKMTETEKKKLKAALEVIGEDVFVVFYMISPSDEKAIFNAVEKIGKVYNFEDSVPIRDASGWINKRSKELGFEIESNAAQALAENCGIDSNKNIPIDILEMSLQRLSLYEPKKKKFEISDVVATAVFYENFVIWDLLNACDEKDYCKCLNMLSKANSLSDNEIEAISQMMGTLLWKFRLLLFLKERGANKVTRQQITTEAASLRKITYEGIGFSARSKIDIVATGANAGKQATVWTSNVIASAFDGFYGRKASVELYSRKELYLIIRAIEDATILLRTCQMTNEAYLIADTVLMTICSAFEQNNISKIQVGLMEARD